MDTKLADLPDGSVAEFKHEFGNAFTVLAAVLDRKILENPDDPDIKRMAVALARLQKQYHKTFNA